MATHTLGYAPEDPVCLVARPWIDHPYGEEEITLLEEERLLEGW